MKKPRFVKGTSTDPRERVLLFLTELNAIIDRADTALDLLSPDPDEFNDACFSTLYSIRETLADMSSDADRRL